MAGKFLESLEENPIVACVKNDEGLNKVIESECTIVFILYGNIVNIGDIVKKVKDSNKLAFIHVDLLEGSSHKDVVIDFVKKHTEADGIISTKAHMIKSAKTHGIYAIHRFFLVDSMSFHNLTKLIAQSQPDCIEILPGCMPKVIGWVMDKVKVPVIAGGLVCDKEDAIAALNAGATAISTTNTDVWTM
ncbi:glycerol-3-phosphate responsive antiterminator [Clostridium sediminicola]|uniref:glycerol-3-phosphate responsive antiterminator n=1 Tax=Clostridium sediminicola TaxID=3114879 RepID=UPI0031F2742A